MICSLRVGRLWRCVTKAGEEADEADLDRWGSSVARSGSFGVHLVRRSLVCRGVASLNGS